MGILDGWKRDLLRETLHIHLSQAALLKQDPLSDGETLSKGLGVDFECIAPVKSLLPS